MTPTTTLPLTVREALRLGSERLAKAGVASPQLDMSLILSHTLAVDRLRLYADLDRELSDDQKTKTREFLARRIKREPIAYLLGQKEFYGLAFEVNASTLIPRPETEHLVEAVLEWMTNYGEAGEGNDQRPIIIADIGTGSGAIAIATAHKSPCTRWIATDISPDALETADRNATKHAVADRIDFRQGDLFAPIAETLDAIISNPPYIGLAEEAELQPEVRDFEPAGALFAGIDGLEILNRLIAGAPDRLKPGGLIALECGAGQAESVAAMLNKTGAFESIERLRDLAGIERVVRAIRKSRLSPAGDAR